MNHTFTIVSYNVCGVYNTIRRDELKQFLSQSQPSVLILQEPKIDHRAIKNGKPRTPSLPPRFPNYLICSFNHSQEPTGVIMYIHKSCSFMSLTHVPHCSPYRPDEDSTRTVAGFVWVSSPLLPTPIVIGGVYMHNSANEADFKALAHSVALASQPLPSALPSSAPLPVFLVGDFNARHPSWDSQYRDSGYESRQGKWLYRHLISHTASTPKLTLLNTHFPRTCMKATHTSPTTDSVIDLAFTTHPHMLCDMNILTRDVIGSDHFPIRLSFLPTPRSSGFDAESQHDSPPPPSPDPFPKHSRVRWKIHPEMDWKLYEQHVAESLQPWNDKYSKWEGKGLPSDLTQYEIDACWQMLLDAMIESAEACVGKINVNHLSQEWWSHVSDLSSLHAEYRRARRHLRQLRKKSVPDPLLPAAHTAYTRARRAFKSAVNQARKKSWQELAASCDNTTRSNKHKLLWSQFKRTVPSSRVPLTSFPDEHGVPPLSPQHALNNMAAHLARTSSLSPDSSHNQDFEQRVLQSVSQISPRPNPDSPIPFSLPDVISACSRFRLNTALGSDNVSPYFLRNGGMSLHRALFRLFVILSRSGLIPTSFRHGHVMTLYKGEGDVNDPSNYRPICITSVVARVYERIHVTALIAAMCRASMPSPEQFGFTKNRSTHDAVFRFLSNLVECVDRGEHDERYSAGVFVDISKAYDKVWIEGLLFKLQKMGISGNLYYMIKSLLTNRTIQVVYGGKVSTTYVLTAGVPQGSILAPFLFLIYIHDIIASAPNSISDVIMSLFADDIALLSTLPGEAGLIPIQQALDHMSHFAARWKITFSAKKTNVVFFRFSQQRHTRPHHTLTLTRFRVATATQYKYLGIVLDDRLTFTPHLHQLASSTQVTSYMISRLIHRDRLPSFPIIRSLVEHMLIPQMTYAFAFMRFENKSVSVRQVTGNSSSKNLFRMLKNNILRPLCISLGLPRGAHHASVFIESRILDIDHLLALAAARLIHRWLSMPADTSNQAAIMFRRYLSSPPRSPLHPFTRMVTATARMPGFYFSTNDTTAFTRLSRSELKVRAWHDQYNIFRSDLDRSLPNHYRNTPVDVKQLPMYTHHDTPRTAAHRARLRFCRARIRYNMHRLNFADAANPTCQKCNMGEKETTHHVLLECSAYAVHRDVCALQLRALAPSLSSLPPPHAQLSTFSILCPELLISRSPSVLSLVLTITGKFIEEIYKIRQF